MSIIRIRYAIKLQLIEHERVVYVFIVRYTMLGIYIYISIHICYIHYAWVYIYQLCISTMVCIKNANNNISLLQLAPCVLQPQHVSLSLLSLSVFPVSLSRLGPGKIDAS